LRIAIIHEQERKEESIVDEDYPSMMSDKTLDQIRYYGTSDVETIDLIRSIEEELKLVREEAQKLGHLQIWDFIREMDDEE
jgi:hypothetical protein